jgi:hypothetical protein
MKLLSVAITHHDANLARVDGCDVRYIKLERTRQEKRFQLQSPLDWKRACEEVWGAGSAEADDYAFSLDPASLPASLQRHVRPDALARLAGGASNAEPLPAAVCDYLGVPRDDDAHIGRAPLQHPGC